MNTFKTPSYIYTGENIISTFDFSAYGKKAFIVTDNYFKEHIDFLFDRLKEQDISYKLFTDIAQEPTDTIVYAALKEFKKEECEFIIAIGGGSVIDTAKLMAVIKEDETVGSLFPASIDREHLPTIAIPTTAGTGSEVTQFTIISDTTTDTKLLLKGPAFLPTVALVDYTLSSSMPKSLTAATGLDAFTHAIEAYTSKKAQPLSDIFAVSALKRIIKFLPVAYSDGQDSEARKQMSLAALEAGIAFNNASVTIVHGMSRPLGALFHIAHGISNAMLLEKCMRYVSPEARSRFASLAKELNLKGSNEEELVEELMNVITFLCNHCEIPSLKEYGVDMEKYEKVIDKMADDAIASGSPGNCIKDISKEDVIKIYRSYL